MSNTDSNLGYMARAIQLAEKPEFSPHPNPRVGCVIVKNNEIVGEGFHAYAGGPHAEVNALSQIEAQVEGQAADLAKGSTVYVTLEPCCFHGRTPPCVDALIKAKVKKVYIAMLDPNPKVAGKGVRTHSGGRALRQQLGAALRMRERTRAASALAGGGV